MPVLKIDGFLSKGEYKGTVEALVAEWEGLERLLAEMKLATGETLEAYKKVYEAKLWRVSNLNAQFYHNVIFEIMGAELFVPKSLPTVHTPESF